MKYFLYFALRFPNLLSESHILLERNATPLRMFSMLYFRKHLLVFTYLKLLIALGKMSTEMHLDT